MTLIDQWIIDSGATCHICNQESSFHKLNQLNTSQEVTLGDGRALKAVGYGEVMLNTKLPDGSSQKCKLKDVLLVPDISYNLLSVSKSTALGNTVEFAEDSCYITNRVGRVIATASKYRELYYVNLTSSTEVHTVEAHSEQLGSKEYLWHRDVSVISMRAAFKC